MGNIDTYNVVVEGTRPLLHHKYTHVTGSKRSTTYVPAEEAKKAAYLLEDGTAYQPAVHIEGALISASKMFKWRGRKTFMDVFKSSVFVNPIEIEFIRPEGGIYKIDERPVKLRGSTIMRWRPRFDDWKIAFQIRVLQPDNLTGDQLEEILEHAGNFVGIGDFRPKFGTFKIVSFSKEED